MLQFDLSEDQELFRRTTRQFLESEAPLTTVRELAESPDGFDRGWWQRGAELGWTSLLISEDLGGGSLSGEGLVDLVLVAEEMGRLVSPGPLAPVSVVAATLAESGAGAAHDEALKGLLSGSSVAAWCGPSLDAAGALVPAVQARPEGEGYRLEGAVEPVEAGAQADVLLVCAATDHGPVSLLVPAQSPGVSVTPLESLDLVRRFAAVRFDGATVPASAVVGEPGAGAAAAERGLQIALALQAAETAGAIDRVLELTIQWAFDRYTFGRPLASYQALKHRFADLRTWLEATHATTQAAVRAVQERAPDAGELVSVAKAYIGEHATELVQDCVQLHGGIGVTWEHDIHLYLRRVTTNRNQHGAPSAHRRRLANILEAREEQ